MNERVETARLRVRQEIGDMLIYIETCLWFHFHICPMPWKRRGGHHSFSFALFFLSFTSPFSLLRKCQNPLPQCDYEPKQCPSCSGLHSNFGPQPDLHSPPFIPTELGDANWASSQQKPSTNHANSQTTRLFFSSFSSVFLSFICCFFDLRMQHNDTGWGTEDSQK